MAVQPVDNKWYRAHDIFLSIQPRDEMSTVQYMLILPMRVGGYESKLCQHDVLYMSSSRWKNCIFDGWNDLTALPWYVAGTKRIVNRYHLLNSTVHAFLPRYTVPKLPLPSCLIVTRSSPIVLSQYHLVCVGSEQALWYGVSHFILAKIFWWFNWSWSWWDHVVLVVVSNTVYSARHNDEDMNCRR